MEAWLASNPRAALIGAIPAVLVTLLGAALCAAAWLPARRIDSPLPWYMWLGLFTLVVGLIGVAVLGWNARSPRLGYRDGLLLVFLRGRWPIRVPLDCVEFFFLGQGQATHECGKPGIDSTNLIVRLAEAASEWQHVEVSRRLGHWCDGYITISGLWCEPLDVELVTRLNHQLREAKRKHQEGAD